MLPLFAHLLWLSMIVCRRNYSLCSISLFFKTILTFFVRNVVGRFPDKPLFCSFWLDSRFLFEAICSTSAVSSVSPFGTAALHSSEVTVPAPVSLRVFLGVSTGISTFVPSSLCVVASNAFLCESSPSPILPPAFCNFFFTWKFYFCSKESAAIVKNR